MADPRLNLLNFSLTNRSSSIPADNCNSAQGTQLSASLSLGISSKGLSLNANVGAYQNLASNGGGTVGEGLRNLSSISDNVRTGGFSAGALSGLPSTSSAGSEFVLNQVGLSSSSLSNGSSVNATVTVGASTQASSIYNQVSQGLFTADKIVGAFSTFQNAVNLVSSIFNPPASATTAQNTQFGQTCGASPYAVDLINLAPKYKFLFVVQFEFDPAFQQIMSGIDPAFVIKTSSRPNVSFDYEDVNQYNFRTKVAKKITYDDMSMKFYDDDHNNAFQFYNAYLKIASPIANVDIEGQKMDPLDAYENVGGGMGFDQHTKSIMALNAASSGGNAVGQGYAASLGPYGTDKTTRNILRKITLFHVYRNGRMMNVYNFYNPKIKSLKLDELDMTQTGEGNEVSLDFTYDSVFIIPGFRVAFNNSQYNLPDITGRAGKYPFGLAPGSVPTDDNPKDGFGLNYGQNLELNNDISNPNSTSFVSIPSTIDTTFDSNTFPVPNVSIPASAGGNDTDSSASGNEGNINGNTTTATRVPDPVTGATQDSANNTGNIANVATQTTSSLDALTKKYNADLAANNNGPVRQQLTTKFLSDYSTIAAGGTVTSTTSTSGS